MSGHNKWSKIKHKKAATDGQRSKIFSKHSLLIAMESRKAGGNLASPGLAAVIERADIDFVDPAKAAVANVSPASITNGIAGIPSSGNTAEDIRADIKRLEQSTDARINRVESNLSDQLRDPVCVASPSLESS